MPQANVIQVAKQAAVQTKAQKEFNKLIKKIEKLTVEVKAYKEGFVHLQQRAATELEPLRKQHQMLQVALVKCYDRAHDSGFFKKTEKKKLVHLITSLAYELIEAGHEELKEIYDKYDEDGFDATNAEADEMTQEMMKQMASSMFGIDIDDDVDLSDPEKLTAYMHQKMSEQQEEQQRIADERRNKKPKTEKQLAREEKKQVEEKNIAKAVRTLYMDLVKAFHPDRETDEAEKERKTQVMHRVTEAYEKNDILGLLKLQMEFNRIDQEHLERLADEQLKYYNKILKEQVGELDDELNTMQMQASMFSQKPAYFVSSILTLNMSFDRDVKEFKKTITQTKKEVEAFKDNSALQLFLKKYRIPKDDDTDFFDMFM